MKKISKRWWIAIVSADVALVLVLLAAFTEWPANLLARPLTINEVARVSDTVIVLGAGSRKHEPHLPPQADARVQTGVAMLRTGYAPKMIVTGGYNKHTDQTEALLMADIAYANGATTEQVILEPAAKDTWENAEKSLAIMKSQGWETALVVTSPYHTWRACAIFRKQKADVRCISAPLRTNKSHTPYERLMDMRSVIREYGAIVYFFLKRYI